MTHSADAATPTPRVRVADPLGRVKVFGSKLGSRNQTARFIGPFPAGAIMSSIYSKPDAGKKPVPPALPERREGFI